MKRQSKIFSAITRGDIILICAVAGLCVIWLLLPFFTQKPTTELVVYLDGEELYRIELDALKEPISLEAGGCEIGADSSSAYFISSPCQDRLCIKKGRLTRQGEVMACVPEKVVIELRGAASETPHAEAY